MSSGSSPRADRTDFHAQGVAQRLPVRSALLVIALLSGALWYAIWTLLTRFF